MTLPLAGRVVAVTRPGDRAAPLKARLEALGAEVLVAPAIEIEPPEDPGAVARALAGSFDLVAVTSAHGARALAGLDLGGAKVAAVGRATEAALEAAGIAVDFVAKGGGAEALLGAIPAGVLAGARVLVPRAEDGLDVFPDGARARGATVEVVAAYRTRLCPEAAAILGPALEAGTLDAIVVTSPSGARALAAGLGVGALAGAHLVAIGGTTLAALEAEGLTGSRAATPDTEGLLAAVLAAVG